MEKKKESNVALDALRSAIEQIEAKHGAQSVMLIEPLERLVILLKSTKQYLEATNVTARIKLLRKMHNIPEPEVEPEKKAEDESARENETVCPNCEQAVGANAIVCLNCREFLGFTFSLRSTVGGVALSLLICLLVSPMALVNGSLESAGLIVPAVMGAITSGVLMAIVAACLKKFLDPTIRARDLTIMAAAIGVACMSLPVPHDIEMVSGLLGTILALLTIITGEFAPGLAAIIVAWFPSISRLTATPYEDYCLPLAVVLCLIYGILALEKKHTKTGAGALLLKALKSPISFFKKEATSASWRDSLIFAFIFMVISSALSAGSVVIAANTLLEKTMLLAQPDIRLDSSFLGLPTEQNINLWIVSFFLIFVGTAISFAVYQGLWKGISRSFAPDVDSTRLGVIVNCASIWFLLFPVPVVFVLAGLGNVFTIGYCLPAAGTFSKNQQMTVSVVTGFAELIAAGFISFIVGLIATLWITALF